MRNSRVLRSTSVRQNLSPMLSGHCRPFDGMIPAGALTNIVQESRKIQHPQVADVLHHTGPLGNQSMELHHRLQGVSINRIDVVEIMLSQAGNSGKLGDTGGQAPRSPA